MSEQFGRAEESCKETVSDQNRTEWSETATQIVEERFWQEGNLEQRIRQRLSRFAAELKHARRLRENR